MNKEARESLRAAIVEKLDDDMMPIAIGGHMVTDEYVYAGGSQWCGQGRDWDTSEHAFAWIVDGQWMLTFPNMFGFDGHNMIERQTGYYLQGDMAEACPDGQEGEPLERVPDAVLLEIAKGLAESIAAHAANNQLRDQEAINLAAKLTA